MPMPWTYRHASREFRGFLGDAKERMRFLSAEDILNIGRREAVIGIRNRQPVEKGLAGRKLTRVHFAPYAAPGAAEGWIRVHADTPSARWDA